MEKIDLKKKTTNFCYPFESTYSLNDVTRYYALLVIFFTFLRDFFLFIFDEIFYLLEI